MTAEELREVVSEYWIVDEIRPARLFANFADNALEPPIAERATNPMG